MQDTHHAAGATPAGSCLAVQSETNTLVFREKSGKMGKTDGFAPLGGLPVDMLAHADETSGLRTKGAIAGHFNDAFHVRGRLRSNPAGSSNARGLVVRRRRPPWPGRRLRGVEPHHSQPLVQFGALAGELCPLQGNLDLRLTQLVPHLLLQLPEPLPLFPDGNVALTTCATAAAASAGCRRRSTPPTAVSIPEFRRPFRRSPSRWIGSRLRSSIVRPVVPSRSRQGRIPARQGCGVFPSPS